MALPYPIAPTQTDVKSPIDQQLMDALRLNQEYLDAQLSAGSSAGIIAFRVNGPLIAIKNTLSLGSGKKLDGGVITSAVTFTNARLYLENGGTSGALEVDVYRHKDVQHAIEKILAQYSGATQAIGRLGSSLATQAISQATPTINTQQITKPKASVNISSIADMGNGDFLYTFSGTSALDSDYEVGDYITFSGCTDPANDGEFQIKNVNYNGLPSVVVNNALGVAQNSAAGTGSLSLYEYTYLAVVDDDIAAGEDIILAGHTHAGNNGTFTIYKTNQGGNNIWLKYAGGDVQAGVAGTAQCTRFSYVFSVLPDDTQYIVGEKAEMSGHTNPANDGKFIIRKVNDGGNNIVVSNTVGVSQGGAAGNVDTLRWLYSTPSDASADVTVGDFIKLENHTDPANDGLFEVKFINRFTANNLEIYNENGVVQAGVAGDIISALKVIAFREDYAASYVVDKSKVALEGIVALTDNIYHEFDVKEINRLSASSYNIVIYAPDLSLQDTASGRVAREARTIFTDRPRIEVAQANVIRNLQVDIDATFEAGGVDADTILTMDILEVPEGLPSNVLLALS